MNITDLLSGNMFAKAREMQERIQDELQKKEVEASAGGGMITVRVNGGGMLTSVKIEPSVVSASDVEMLQDLVLAAVNEGVRKSRTLLKEEIAKLTGGGFPDIFGSPS